MPLELIRRDITDMHTDAIVNAANSRLQRGGGVCGAIFARADGNRLQQACDRIGYCAPGDAVITESFGLPAPRIIHTVGPVWHGGQSGEAAQLVSCYRSSLNLALRHGLTSVAFPLISSGIYGYPPRQALSAAISAISDWLMTSDSDMMVYLVLFDRSSFAAGSMVHRKIRAYIDDHYVDEHIILRRNAAEEACLPPEADEPLPEDAEFAAAPSDESEPPFPMPCAQAPASRRLEDLLRQTGESFSQMLFRLIDEKGLSDPDVYKRANLDRKLFSKIRSNPQYQPGKSTVLALTIALKLNPDQAADLLRRAGFALSPSSKTDLIVEYCLSEGIYNIHTVNQVLFEFDQKTLGAQ